jgi:hypothetical protein
MNFVAISLVDHFPGATRDSAVSFAQVVSVSVFGDLVSRNPRRPILKDDA